jgi:hypothetical protein
LSAIGDARLELDEAGAPADRDKRSRCARGQRVGGWGRAPRRSPRQQSLALVAVGFRAPPRRPCRCASAPTGADVPLTIPLRRRRSCRRTPRCRVRRPNTGGRRLFYVRRLSQSRDGLSGTEDADNPFFSPTDSGSDSSLPES